MPEQRRETLISSWTTKEASECRRKGMRPVVEDGGMGATTTSTVRDRARRLGKSGGAPGEHEAQKEELGRWLGQVVLTPCQSAEVRSALARRRPSTQGKQKDTSRKKESSQGL
ncbi:MAG: hypothetical protein M1835_003546 [Candelina submexicana]|nr:MAG: hypothetical protein M1835_003546 [Candelina submexicana]